MAEHVGVIYYNEEVSETSGTDIFRYADKTDVDLVTIGTYGRRRVKRVLLGSVAE